METTNALLQKVQAYQPAPERLAAFRATPLLFVVGISGAGKDTIIERLLDYHPTDYHPFVTHTTRPPRANHGIMEQDGKEYYFIDFATAERMLDNKNYIEVNAYSGNIYGTSLSEIAQADAEQKIVLADIDVNGVANFVRLGMNARPVFVLPPGYTEWQQRIMRRYTGEIDRSDWQKRMIAARDEIEHALATDYFYFVINDDLAQVVKEIDAIAHGHTQERRSEIAITAAKDILNGINDALATT